jgi:hypothetical protein
VLSFIGFCIEWHERLGIANQVRDESQALVPDASEFDAYKDIVDANCWFTKVDGEIQAIETPVFWEQSELSWRNVNWYDEAITDCSIRGQS